MSDTEETSAGETGGREAMSDERLAEIRDVYADDHEAIGELAAEVERLNRVLHANTVIRNAAESNARVYKSLASTLREERNRYRAERDAETKRAETAERELAEMRERIGDWQPGRWHQVRQPNGDLWMETSDRDEAVTAARETGWALYRLWECHGSEWREATDGA